ncbi:MAG: hypothetical protein VX446_07370, partial [Bacteroidota bacterium]|nr:hypothetical protein [Bacteroidota bacterium]
MDVPVQLDVPFPARVFLWHCDSALIDRQVDDAMASMRQLALMSDSAAAEHVLAETRSNVQLYRFTETDKATPPDDPCLAPKAPMFGLPGLYEAIVDYPLSFVGFVLQYLHRQADGTPALSLSTPLADIVRASFQTKRFRYVFESAAYSLPLSPAFLKVLLCLPRWTQSEHVRGMVLEAMRSLPADVCGKVLEDVAGTQECPLVTWKVLDGARYGERLTARQWSAAPNVLARLAECGKLRSVQHLVGPTASCPKPRGAAMTTLVADNASVTFRSVLLSELCGGLPSDDVLHHLMVTAMRNNADECVSVIMTAKPRLRCRVVNEETLRAFLTMDRGLQVMVLQEYNYMTLTSLLHSPAVTNELLMTNALSVMGVNPRRSWFAVSLWVRHTEMHPEALDSDDGCDAGDWIVRAVGLWDRFLDQAAHVLSCPVVMKLVERGLWSQLKHVGLRLPLHRWMVWPGDIVPLYRASLGELPPV